MKLIKILFGLAILATSLHADSIWPGGAANSGNTQSLITDKRALKVGDLVTVKIIENATAQQSANMTTNKSASVGGSAGQGSWDSSSTQPIQGFGAGAAEGFDGGGTSSRSGTIVTTLTARVVQVLDSGNLLIEGRRSLKINDEKQNIYVRGVIRIQDVGRNNTILSSSISDAQIMYLGKGPLTEKANAGFFTRILDWLGIF